ncbi:tail fiber protein [Flavobacterium sp. DGU11]|uniref:Tail fiber protein n=1 Tax=Flavobacterium arundinis TaxID=3139143 RepID=A0ABU9HT50_9FLAO
MDEYIGIIKLFGGNFAPRGWAFCTGQILPISQYTAVFSLLGTTYGGDGISNFALPDLRSRVPVGMGQGPGLSDYTQGEMAGEENVSLLTSNLPSHSHAGQLFVSAENATDPVATNDASIASPGTLSGRTFSPTLGFAAVAPDTVLNTGSIRVGVTGGNIPISILQPYIGMNYIICLEGIYPPRP